MKLNRNILLVGLAGVSTVAFGQYTSPELIMVTDDGGTLANGTTVQAQVERYDPTTGAYLGAFGAGYLTAPTGISVVGQDAYVTDTFTVQGTYYSKIDKFNFSTGAFEGSIFSGSPYYLDGLTTYGTNILASDYGDPTNANYGTGFYTYNSSGAQTGFQSAQSGVIGLNVAADANNAYLSGYGGLTAYGLDANGVSTGAKWTVGTSNDYFGVGTSQYIANTIFAGGLNGNGGVLDEYNSSGELLSEYTNANAGYEGIGFGHNDVMYALDGSEDEIARFDGTLPVAFGPMGTFTLSETADPSRMAVYAAPEPFSMAGLAIGAFGLIARRRRQRSN